MLLLTFYLIFLKVNISKFFTAGGITGCKRGLDLKVFNQCVRDKLDNFKPALAKGIDYLQIPRLDPYVLPQLKFYRTLPFLNVKADVTNIMAKGFKNFVIQDLFLHPETLEARVVLKVPRVSVTADYNLKGKILAFKLPGAGKFFGNFGNKFFLIFIKYAHYLIFFITESDF